MSQLIKATVTPYEAVHLRQSARLVSSGNLDAERRKIMAMQARFQFRYSGHGAASDPHHANQVRRAFTAKNAPQQITPETSATDHVVATSVQPKVSTASTKYPSESVPAAASYSTDSNSFSEGNTYIEQAQASYAMEKASFDLRVSSGDLSYVPAFDFTIVLQKPGVEFEYMGGFNYVPPSWSPVGENVNMVL